MNCILRRGHWEAFLSSASDVTQQGVAKPVLLEPQARVFLSYRVDHSFHLDRCFIAAASSGHRVFLVVPLIQPINWVLKVLSQICNNKISHRQIVWMLPYQLGHQPHLITSSTWTLISHTWPRWKTSCHPQHGCVHQPAGLGQQHRLGAPYKSCQRSSSPEQKALLFKV